MGCRLGRRWLVPFVGYLMPVVTGCGRVGLGQVGRDAGSVPDLARSQEDLATPTDLRAFDGLGPEGGWSDGATGNRCNNGVLDPGEDCEDGNFQAGDGCDPTCHYEPGLYGGCPDCCPGFCYACTDGCIEAALRPCHCGNRMLERGEQCDDGNLRSGDGCNKYCGREVETCGNGVLDPGEDCEDGNRKNGDGCDAACLFDPASIICSSRRVCVDGNVSGRESCDDGNLFAGDGCSPNCSVEAGYYCPRHGEPCVPIPAVSSCGNGRLDPWEACDDGVNDGRYNGCIPDCSVVPRCGDDIVQPEHELCDDGGRNAGGYGWCGGDCMPGPRCGDGVVQSDFEECDMGENNGADGVCTADCKIPQR